MRNHCSPDELLDGLVSRLAEHGEDLETVSREAGISMRVLSFLLRGYRNPSISTLRKLHSGLEKMAKR